MRSANRPPKPKYVFLIAILICGLPILCACQVNETNALASGKSVTPLPEPQTIGPLSLEEALLARRSTRAFSDQEVDLESIAQLLWAAQGITHPSGLRTAPSAGALYPLELYLVSADGVFHYLPEDHALETIQTGDFRADLHAVALQQDPVLGAPLVFVVTAVYARTSAKYGPERSPRYVHLEAGHAAQNLLLQATALGLGAVPIGAFDDSAVQDVLSLPLDHQPLYLIPVGHPE